MSVEERRQERVIDGVLYSVVPLTTAKGLQTLDRFKNVIAPLLSSAVIAKSGLEEAAAQAMKALPSALDYQDVKYFQETFGDTSCYVDGNRRPPLTLAAQELHFAGRYMALFDWLTFCMEVNFSGFFGELKRRAKDAMDSLKEQVPKSSASPTTTGLFAAS